MRLYHIVTGIPLILPIIDFAAAAPVLVQVKRHATVDAHIPEDSMTTFGKRGYELNELGEAFPELIGDYEGHFPSNPSGTSITGPLPISKPSLPGGSMDVEESMPPSVPEEPSQVPNHYPPPDDDWGELLNYLLGHPDISFTTPASSSAHLSSNLQPLEPTGSGGWMTINKELPSISEESSQISSSDRASLTADDGMMKTQPDFINPKSQYLTEPNTLRVAHPSSSPQPPGRTDGSIAVNTPRPSLSPESSSLSFTNSEQSPVIDSLSSEQTGRTGGSMDIDESLPSTFEEPPQAPSSNHERPSSKELSMNTWRYLVSDLRKNTYAKPQTSSITPPLSGSQQLRLANEWLAVEKSKVISDVKKNTYTKPPPPVTPQSSGPIRGLKTIKKTRPSISKKKKSGAGIRKKRDDEGVAQHHRPPQEPFIRKSGDVSHTPVVDLAAVGSC